MYDTVGINAGVFMSAALSIVAFYIFTVILGFLAILALAGTQSLRTFIIRFSEYAAYIILVGFIVGGGLSASWSSFVFAALGMNNSGLFLALILGSVCGFIAGVPLVAILLLHIDIARNTQRIASK